MYIYIVRIVRLPCNSISISFRNFFLIFLTINKPIMNVINVISRVPNCFKVHAELPCTRSLFDLLKKGLQVSSLCRE